ncbi:MAG: hypothetical protein ACOC2H_02805 [Spirochaetota bacterium]
MNRCIAFCFAALLTVLTVSCTTLQPPETEREDSAPAQPEEPAERERERDEASDFAPYEQITITKGDHDDKIRITWETDNPEGAFVLLRSVKKEEPYREIARISGRTEHVDTEVQPGLKVYYRMIPLPAEADAGDNTPSDNQSEQADGAQDENFELDDTGGDVTEQYAEAFEPESKDLDNSNYGYASVKKPSSKDLNRIMRSYTQGKTGPQTDEQKKYYEKHMSYMKEKYEHPVKLNMILTVTKPYISSGRLEVHRGFEHLNHDRGKRTVYIFNGDHSAVYIFNNNITSGNLSNTSMRSLFERLIFNSVAFCGYIGEKEVTDEKGYVRIIPAFDVVALAAQYYPRYRNWKEATYLIVTSDKKLRREIQKAQRDQ